MALDSEDVELKNGRERHVVVVNNDEGEEPSYGDSDARLFRTRKVRNGKRVEVGEVKMAGTSKSVC